MKLASDPKKLLNITVTALVAAYGDLNGPGKYRENGARCAVINQASRAVIRARRPCFIGKVNLYGDERGKTDTILREYRKGMVYNFGGSFVVPAFDQELVDLIHARDTAPYTGTADDMIRITAIYDRIEVLGGTSLHWE